MSAYPPSCDPCDDYSTTTAITTTTIPIADGGSDVAGTGLIAAATLSVGFVIWLFARRRPVRSGT
jgi:hypothetical protein